MLLNQYTEFSLWGSSGYGVMDLHRWVKLEVEVLDSSNLFSSPEATQISGKALPDSVARPTYKLL